MLYQCSYGSAPGPNGIGRIAMYEVHDLAGEHVEAGFGETIFETSADAVKEAMELGHAAVERLHAQTVVPRL
jgi:hypothetical protein